MLPIASATAAAVQQRAPAARPAATSFGEALRAQGARALAEGARPPAGAAAAARRALEQVEAARRRLDDVLSAAQRGQTFTPQELLALQVHAYRYAQTVDVASRAVEHAAQAVKQAVNTNV